MEGVYAYAPPASTYSPPELPTATVLKQDTPPSLARSSVLESRIKLDPIDEQPKMPSPHLSAPVLPPIKRPRPVSAKVVDGLPNSSKVAAISQNLSTMHINSAASFPAIMDEIEISSE